MTFLRNATVYGLSYRMRFDLVINIMTLYAYKHRRLYVMGGGQQWRPLIHVRDVARAFIMVMDAPQEKVSGEAFNVGSNDQNYQIYRIAQMVRDVVPHTDLEVVPDDPDKRSYNVNFEKIERVLGFRCREDAVRRHRRGEAGARAGPRGRHHPHQDRALLPVPARRGKAAPGSLLQRKGLLMSRVEFYRHALTEDDIAAAADTLRSVFLTTGPRAALFEEAFATYLGRRTRGRRLELHQRAVPLPQGARHRPGRRGHHDADDLHRDGQRHPARRAPRRCSSMSSRTPGNIDARQVERAITSRTRAVIPVHLYGLMADVQDLNDICQRHKLMMIEDAAHATEAVRDGFRPGQLGQAACFSFYATKNLTCGEGGAIATNDPALAESVRRLRSHGMSKEAAGRYTSRYQHWDMLSLGYKANLSDIQAALLVGQLPRLEAQLARREAIASRYEAAFSELPGVGFPVVRENATSARHLFTIWVEPGRRDECLWKLQEKGIGVAVNYRAVHLLSYYRSEFGFQRGRLPLRRGDRRSDAHAPAVSDDDRRPGRSGDRGRPRRRRRVRAWIAPRR